MRLATEEHHGSFKLIAACFQSNLPFRVKLDCVCRIIALRYSLPVVSILQLDGMRDKLVNKGFYINPSCLAVLDDGKFADQQAAINHLLQHISFYDFLYYKFYRSGIPAKLTGKEITFLINEFRQPDKVAFNYRFDTSVLTPAFVLECHHNSILLATDGLQQNGFYQEQAGSFYINYKKKIPGLQQYAIGLQVRNYSGRVFQLVMDGLKPLPDVNQPFVFIDELFSLTEASFKMEERATILEKGLREHCGLVLTDYLSYCGIPLGDDNRPVAVMRALLSRDAVTCYSNDQERIKSLRHATEAVAYFLDHSYGRDQVEEIVYDPGKDTGGAGYLTEIRNRHCTYMCRELNATGALLRLSEQPGQAPTIAGRSTDCDYFSHLVDKFLVKQPYDGFIKGPRFNDTLSKCFSSTHAGEALCIDDRYRLIGVKLDIQHDPFLVTYYYCYATEPGKPGNETVMETTEDIIFKPGQKPSFNGIFHYKTLAALRKTEVVDENGDLRVRSIRYVLIMDIPALDVDGIFTAAASANRPFSLNDVQFAYGEMKRFGNHMSSIRKVRLMTYQTMANTYLHELKNIIEIGMFLVQQVLHPVARQNPGSYREIISIRDILKLTHAKILAFKQMADSNLQAVMEERQHKEWSIDSSIKTQCRILSMISEPYKGFRICVRKEIMNNPKTRLNQEVFDLCLFNLLTNAVKYSYGKDSIKKVPGYIARDETTPGHVQVYILEEEDSLVIRIANWGSPIPDPGAVFQKLERSPEAESFLRQENRALVYKSNNLEHMVGLWQQGTSNGLYLVNNYINTIGGSCTCEADGDYTCFTLKIPKEKKHEHTSWRNHR